MTLPPLEELKRLNGRRDLPWKVTENNAVTDRFGWSIFVDEETNDTVGTATPQDAQLVALSPDLLAEVIRLREALEKQLDGINLMIAMADMIQPQTEAQQTAITLGRDLCDDLTRILNGDI